MIDVKILTAYPEMFPGSLEHSVLGKALKENIFKIDTINLHEFGIDDRMSIDDEPFGGGPGMIIRPDVIEKAVLSIKAKPKLLSHRIYLTPGGKSLNQEKLGYLVLKFFLKLYLPKLSSLSLFHQFSFLINVIDLPTSILDIL